MSCVKSCPKCGIWHISICDHNVVQPPLPEGAYQALFTWFPCRTQKEIDSTYFSKKGDIMIVAQYKLKAAGSYEVELLNLDFSNCQFHCPDAPNGPMDVTIQFGTDEERIKKLLVELFLPYYTELFVLYDPEMYSDIFPDDEMPLHDLIKRKICGN